MIVEIRKGGQGGCKGDGVVDEESEVLEYTIIYLDILDA